MDLTLEQAKAIITEQKRELALKDAGIEELLSALNLSERKIKNLQTELKRLLRRLYGPKSEAFTADPDQLIFDDLLAQALEQALEAASENTQNNKAEETEVPAHTRRRHGRMDLATLEEVLECENITVDVPEDDKICPETGMSMKVIGEEITRKLDIVPSRVIIKRYIRPKYASPPAPELGVTIAELPEFPIPKCELDVGLIAEILVSKYQDHKPLYRIERSLEREGVHLSRSTMSDVALRCAVEVLYPLYQCLMAFVLGWRYIFSDDTRMPMQVRFLKPEHQGELGSPRMWVYGNVPAPRQVVYQFTLNRTNEGPLTFLDGYSGYLQADAYSGYEAVFNQKDAAVIEVGCWAHARRKFDESLDSSPRYASEILGAIRECYRIEHRANDAGVADADERLAIRQQYSAPIIETLYERMNNMILEVLPKLPIASALGYAINQKDPLTRFLTDGQLLLDNNLAENHMRPLALGRKNYLFVGSERGGQAAAIIYSLAESCRLVNVNPVHYFKDVLWRIQSHPPDRLSELIPANWEPGPPPGNYIVRPPMPRGQPSRPYT